MISRSGLIAAIVLSVASVAFLCGTGIPLGIPGEWTWTRIDVAGSGMELFFGAVQAAIAGTVFILFAWLGAKRIAFARRAEVSGWLIGMVVAGFAWLLAVQEAPPSGWRLSKAAFVVYYPGASGYFHRATYDIADTSKFLRTYEELMAEGDVLHVGTHPPGLFVLYRGLIAATDAVPALSEAVLAVAPASIQEAFDTIDQNLGRTGRTLERTDRAVIWLATLLTQLSAAVAVIPLFLLLCRRCPRETAWKVVAFWPLLPALAIFIPKSDVLFVLPAALLLWVWITAAQRRSFVLGAIAGAVGWAGLFCSLVFLPIGLIALLASIIDASRRPTGRSGCAAPGSGPSDSRPSDSGPSDSRPSDSRPSDLENGAGHLLQTVTSQLTKPLSGGALMLAGLTAAVWFLTDMNLIEVWLHNYRNHAAFYDQFQRTVWKWLLVNPVELALAVGAPFFVLVASQVIATLREGKLLLRPFLLSTLSVWGLLWLSGKSSGEAARLWIPLMTTLPVLACRGEGSTPPVSRKGLQPRRTRESTRPPHSSEGTNTEHCTEHCNEHEEAHWKWLTLLACQSMVCIATVTRASGFHF